MILINRLAWTDDFATSFLITDNPSELLDDIIVKKIVLWERESDRRENDFLRSWNAKLYSTLNSSWASSTDRKNTHYAST